MKISEMRDDIRQQQYGRFRMPEEGKGPFTHANGQKSGNTKVRENVSIYIENERVFESDKGLKPESSKIFDTDAGMKLDTPKGSKPVPEEKHYYKSENTAQTKTTTQQASIIDEWV